MKKSIKNKGFTIVELLVVIVVIGILTAITIVSYSGITAKANTSANLANANNLMTKINTMINDDTANAIPITFETATALSNSSPALTGLANFGFGDAGVGDATNLSVANGVISMSKAPATTNTVMFQVCGYKKITAGGAVGSAAPISKPTALTSSALTGYYNELTAATNVGAVSYQGNVTGIKVSSWKYAEKTSVDKTYGVTSGTSGTPAVQVYCVPANS